MREERASDTAQYVTMGRALAHARGDIPGFDDPFALDLLSSPHREAVLRRLHHAWPRTRREAGLDIVAESTARLMGPRTVEIDQGIRDMAPGFQLVIVGAGLDMRAYRMKELAHTKVFELDHPASQALKKRLVEGLEPRASELLHVPLDLTKQSLERTLEEAGHTTDAPTAWVFEGVISYLTPKEVETAIASMASRSRASSRLLTTYNEENLVRRVFASVTARGAEPHRAWYSRLEMRALLAKHGFVVRSDRDGRERQARHGQRGMWLDAGLVRFHHVVIADFLG